MVPALLSHKAMSAGDRKTALLPLPAPEQHTERLLLERLKNSASEDDYFRWLLFVVGFYRGVNKIEAATALLNGFLEKTDNNERKAHCQLALGQIATDQHRLDAALSHFLAALGFAPKRKRVAYVLHNNIGYCLNMLGRYAEGEKYCRGAIDINSKRASGYRNLGVSLQGQKSLIGAAWALTEAMKAEASDPRAGTLLQKLLAEHPTIVIQCPWIADGLNPDVKTAADALPI
jgi:tetratricopeptide (TPR) repeat protein